MDIDEIIGLLPETVREVAKDRILSEIDQEKQRVITEYRKKDSEVLKYKNTLRDIGYDPETFASVEEFKTSIKTKTAAADTSNLTLKMLQEQLSDIKTQLVNETNLRVTSEEKVKTGSIKQLLVEQIGGKFYGDQYLIENIISSKQLDIIDNKVVANDGRPFEQFITDLFEQNKDNLKVEQKTGVAITVKPGAVAPLNKNTFSDKLKEQFKKK